MTQGFAWERWGRFGGAVCLDFVNTVEDEDKGRARSGLPDWATAVRWAAWAELTTAAESAALSADADGDRAFAALHTFKESAWRLLSATAAGDPPAAADLSAVARALAEARGAAQLTRTPEGYAWRAAPADLGAEALQVRLALDLDALLISPELSRLRECARCTGLYLDRGRGAGRRWCRMATCGNRAKVARFRAKA